MLRENKDETRIGRPAVLDRLRLPQWVVALQWRWRDLGLPAKLLLLTSVFVMLADGQRWSCRACRGGVGGVSPLSWG